MNQNIFRNAIRDVKKTTNNNFRSTLKLDKKNIGREFTEEIDFERESLNLGEDINSSEENFNDYFKVTKLRSSFITSSKNSYPSSFDRAIDTIKNKNPIFVNNNFNNFKFNFNNNINVNNINHNKDYKEILIPKRNNNLIIKNSHNQEILIRRDHYPNNVHIIKNSRKEFNGSNDNLSNNHFHQEKFDDDKWRHDKFNESILLKYSIFIRNLPMNITETKLREIFSNCGPILSLYVNNIS